MDDRDNIFGRFDAGETLPASKDNTLLGNALALGSCLIAKGALPEDVVEGNDGSYALCLVTREGGDVRPLRKGDSIAVGREPESASISWKIADPWMSRRHFRVSVDDTGSLWLHCHGAKNGTFINDHAADGHTPLRRGDVIRAGNSSFLVL